MTEEKGRITRRAALRMAITMAALGIAERASAQQQPVQKVAQSVVHYQTSPKNGQSCSKCVNFDPPNACKVVASPIVPNGWCLLFAPKPT